MSVLPVGFGSSGGLQITNSVRLRAAASAYFSRTFGAPTNQNIWTISAWVKLSSIGSGTISLLGRYDNGSNFSGCLHYGGANAMRYGTQVGGAWTNLLTTTSLYRDPSAHGHLMFSFTSGSAANIYWNGTLIGTLATPAVDAYLNHSGTTHYIGYDMFGGYSDGYISDYHFIDGQALTPSDFGETNADNVWVPKAYAGSYGNNGFHLDFKDAALTAGSNVGLGKDVSGNGNYWTTNNISVTAGVTYDSMVDTPTNNYATLNPLDQITGRSDLTNGNLKISTGAATSGQARSTIKIPSAVPIYFEGTIVSTASDTNQCNFGVLTPSATNTGSYVTGMYSVTWATSGRRLVTSGSTSSYAGAAITAGQVAQCAVDIANGKAWIGVADTWFDSSNGTTGNPSAGTNPTFTGLSAIELMAFVWSYSNGWDTNFGQRPFTYTPPTGFKALCTANLPAVAITNPAEHFMAKTRIGTGAAFNVTGIEFSPDLVWTKGRSGATDHALYDPVRGVQKDIGTNLATDETTQAQGLTAFNSDGFTGGTLAKINTNAATYIDWMWNESVTAGIDVVSYTGNGANRTIAHDLNAVPKLIIIKSRATAGADTGWPVYHGSLANTEYMKLETTAAKATGATYWNSTTPISSVFSLGTAADVNTNNDTYIAYLFAEVAGFSKFDQYIGNAAADGTFVYTGFRPRFLLLKRISTTGSWVMLDTARGTYNLVDSLTLLANTSGSEATNGSGWGVEILSNGFKFRVSTDPNNGTYVYAAFAEYPFGGSNVSPSPAR